MCGAQGGYSGFQVTGMIEWGQKSKPKKIPRASNKTKKIPGPKINLQKNPIQNFTAGIRGHYQESSDCFEYRKKSLLKSSHPLGCGAKGRFGFRASLV